MTRFRGSFAAVVGLCLALLVALGAALLQAGPAAAHAGALGTEPAPGATLESSPTQVLVRFGAPVDIGVGALRLIDSTGKSVPIGAAEHPRGEKNAVAASVSNLSDGGYAALYQVISADGHLTRGAFTFQIGKTSTAVAPSLVSNLSESSDKGPLAVATLLARLLTFAGALAAVGGLLFLARCWPQGTGDRRAGQMLRVAGVLALVGSIAMLATAAGQTAGRGLGGMFDTVSWRGVIASRPGKWWLVRTAGAVVLAGSVLLQARLSPRLRLLVGLAGGLVMFLGMGKGGHGTSGRWPAVGVALTVVHLLAASAWVGGLAMGLRALSTPHGLAALRRFSPFALWSVVVVAISGAAQSWRQLRDWTGWTSRYGLSLRNKIVVVAVLVAIGGASRFVLRKAEPQPEPAPADGNGDDGDGVATPGAVDPTQPGIRLRDLVGLEVLFSAGVLALTMALINIPPPAPMVPKPFSTLLVVGTRTADIIVEPAGVGVNTVHVTVTNNDGAIRNPTNITIRLSLPSKADLPPLAIDPTKRLANHATFDNVLLPYPGDWKLEALAIFANETVRFSTSVKVR